MAVGGARALEALQIAPSCLHLQEGHAALVILEIVRQTMETQRLSRPDAMLMVSRQTLFTTHTPVEAGFDWFAADLVEEHLGPLCDELGLSHAEHSLSLAGPLPSAAIPIEASTLT